MLKAWGFLEHHQLAVELQVQSRGSKGVPEELIRKILADNVHLRPEAILAATPIVREHGEREAGGQCFTIRPFSAFYPVMRRT